MNGMAQVYFSSARRTGRTTSLVESVKDGDRIVFADTKEAARVKKLCRERGVEVDCLVVDVAYPSQLFGPGTSQGRTVFDHSWVAQYYRMALQRAQQEIDHLERESSGYGEAHRETRRKAEELARWSIL